MKKLVDTEFTGENAKETLLNKDLNTSKEEAFSPLPDKVSATPAPVLHRESDTKKSKFIPVEFREEPTSYGANFDVSSGKYPSSGELLSEIGRVWKDGNTDKAKELFNMYYSRTQDSTSSYYQPYSKHTNSTALDKISELTGIDFSGGITQDQINALWQMADTSKVGINGTYSSAKKNTAAQQLAYYLSVVQTDEETTQKAESELEQLMGDIQYLVGRGYSDEYVKQNVDMSKYSTLKKAMDAQNTVGGVLPNFNRAINLYGADTINGMIWAARNTTDGVYSGMSDIMNYYGFGSGYKPDVNSEAARDYTSDMYHPYSFGASDTKTMNAICKKYGITGWDEKWVEEHASELIANGDYGDAYKAAKNTAEAQSQLDALKKVCTDLLSKEDGSYNAEKVYSYVTGTLLKDSKYAMLNKMETARTDKEEHSAVALSDTVDFALPYFKSWLEDEEKKIVKGREAKARATIDELMPNSKEEREDKDYYYHYAMFCLNLKEGVKTNTERTAQEVLNFIQSEGNEKFIRQEGQSYEDYANGLGIYTQQLVEEKNEEEREAKKEAALTVQATDGFTMESFTDSTSSMDKKDAADEWESFYEGIEDEIHGFGATDGNSKAWCESEIGSVLLSSTGRGATVSQTGYDTAGVVDKRTARLGNGIGLALNTVDEAHKNGAISTREYVKYLVALSTAMEKYGGIEAFKNAYNEGDENSEEYKLVHSLDATIETNTKAIELNTLKKNKQTATVAGNLLANPPAIMTEAQSQLYQSVLSVNLGEVKDADWTDARETAVTYAKETYYDKFITDFGCDENEASLAVNAIAVAAMMRINDVMRIGVASGIGFNDALDATYSGTLDDLIEEATRDCFGNYQYSYNSIAETVNTVIDTYSSWYQGLSNDDTNKVIDDNWITSRLDFLTSNGMLDQESADEFMEYYNSSEDKSILRNSLYAQLEGKEDTFYGNAQSYFASEAYKTAESQLEKQENGKGVAVLARGVTGDNQGGFFKALGLGAEMGWYQHKDTWLNVGEAFVRMDDAHREATYRDEYTRPELYQEITRQIMTIDDDDLQKRLLDQLNNYQGDIYDFDFDLKTVAIQDWRAQNEKKMQLVQEEGLNVLTPKEYELMMSMQNVVNSGFISAETAALTAILTGFGVPEFAGLLLANFAVTGSTEGASTTLALLDAGVNQNTARFMGLTNAIVTGATEAYFDETITWFMAKSNFGRAIDGAFDLDSASIANAVGSWLYGKTGSKGLSTIASYASGFLANTAQELLKSAISEPLQEGFEELSAQATEGAGKASEGMISFWDSFDISAVFDVMGETFKNTVLQYAVGGGIMGNASKAVSSILGGSAGAVANLAHKNVEGAAESFKGGFEDAKSVGSKLVEFFKSGKLTQSLEEDYLALKNAFAFKTTKANQYAEQQSDYIRDEFNEFLQECFYETEKDKIAAREGTKAWVEIDEGQIGETVRKAQADYDAALANVETAQSAVKQAQEVLEQRTEDVKNNETPTKQEANGLVEAKGVTEDAKSALAQAETNLQNAKQQLENARMARRTAFAQAMQASREVAAQQIEEIKAKKLAAVEAQRQANYETFKNEYLTRYTDTNTKGFNGLNNYWLVGLAQQESEKLWGTSDMMEKYAEMQSQACMKVVNLLENAFFGYSVEVTSDFDGSMGIDTKAKKIYINPNITFEQMFTGMIAHEMGHLAKATGKVEELMKSMMDTFYNGSKDSSAYKDAVEWVHEHAPETVGNEDLTNEEVFTYTIESLFAGGKLNNLGGMPIMTFAKMLVNNDMELGSDLYTFLMKQAVVVREMNKDKFFKKELQKAQTQYADFVAQLADAIKGSQEVLKESASETAQAGEISDDTSKTENDTTEEVMPEKSVDVEGENTEKQQAIAPAAEKAALPAPKQKLLLPSPVKTLFDNEATEAKTDTPVVETAEDYKKMVEGGADFAFSQMVKPDLPVFTYNPQTAEYALADGVIEELSEDAKAIVEAAVETGTEAQYNAAHAESLDNIWTEEREETRKSVLDGIKQEYMEVLDGANDKALEDVDAIVQEQLDEKLIKPEDMEIINEWRSGKFVAPKTEGIGMTPAENEVDIADRETYEYTTAPKEGADIEYTFTGKQKGVNKKTAFNDKKVTPFYNTHWDQFYFARNMAERLLEDAGNYYAPETIVTEAEYGGVPEFTRTKSSSTPELQQLSRFFSHGKGSSYERMWNAIQEFIDAYDNNKPIKNTAGMKALEVTLHNMLTRGYTMITGERIPSNTEYINLRKGNATEAVADAVFTDGTTYEEALENKLDSEHNESVDIKYSHTITDENLLNFLENQDHITTYRSMQLIDGKLYPPMAETINGELEGGLEVGEWEQAVEHPELVITKGKDAGKFPLLKTKWNAKKYKFEQSRVPAAYNPYVHSSNVVLNDQFSAAYLRPNLVTVECEVPTSELNGAYRAENAKDATGWTEWKSGSVANELKHTKGIERSVFLSRYLKAVRILNNTEVAQKYADLLDGTNIEVADNVVPPNLLKALREQGVPIKESGLLNGEESFTPESYQRLLAEYRKNGNKNINKDTYLKFSKTGADTKTFVDANGDELMDVIDGVATKCSHTTWNMTDKEKMLDNLIKGGHDAEKARAWINAVNAIDAIIAENTEKLDFDATKQPFMKKNAEYVITLDASTLCDKRRLYQGTFNAIQHILSKETLSSEDMIKITNLLRKNGLKAPCAICYVESRRRHIGEYAEEWLAKWDGDYKPSMDELTTTDGLSNLEKTHPEVAKAFTDSMNRKGTANPKLVQLRTAYNGDLTKLTPKQIKKITALGGVRIQSFSDFEAVHTLDMMQSILDMASMNLTSQAYTKVPNFAKIFGKTGIKINLSLIAEGVDENGKLILSSTEGMDVETALKLRNGDVEGVTEDEEKQKYRENVGTIVVVGNEEQLRAAMADDRIDYIIPFHKSGWGNKEIALLDALVDYKDFTKYQTEHRQNGFYKNGNPNYVSLEKGKKQFSPYGSVPYGQKGYNGYWDYNLTGDENAAKYLKMCEDDKRIPKFYNVLTKDAEGHWVAPSGYWKLLIGFKMYDNNGVGAPQKTVVADFNTVAAEKTLNEYKESGEQANVLPVSKKVVGQFIEGFNTERGTDYQIPDQYKSADADTMKSRTFSDLGKTVRDALIDAYNTLAAEALDKGDITSYRQMMGRMYGQLAKHQGNTSSKLDTPLNTLKLLANDLGTHIYDKIKMGRAEVEVGTMEGDGETNPLLMNAKIQAKYDAWSNAISTDYVSGKTFAGIMGGIADTAFQRLVNAGIIGSTDEQTAGEFADWFFNYMTHNDAQLTNTAKAYAKTFADAISEDGDAKTRNMWSAIQMRRKQISGYINADSYTKTMTYLKSKSERKENPGKNWVDNIRGFLTTTVDRSLIASVVDESATNNTHALQNAVLYSPYMLRRAEKVLSGRSFVDADGHELKQFATLAQEIEKSGMEPGEDNYKTFNTYIMVMAALDRIGQGKNPFNVDENIELLGFTVAPNEEELKEVARNIEATRPDVVKAAEGFWRFNRNFIQTYLVNEGLLDAKTWADWQEKTPHYASLKRYMDENPNASASSAKNNALGVTLEKFVGHSNRQIINPVESMVDMVHSVVKGVTQNRTKQVFADLIDNNPDTGFIAKRVDANEVNIHDSDVIAVHTYNPVQSTEIAGNNENVHDVSNENPIETRYYKINNKELYNLLAGVDTAQVNKAAKAFGKVTRTMTMLTTGVNALFTGKNAIRDFQHSVNYGTWAYTYLDGLFKWVSAYRDIGKELKNGTGSQQARDYVNLGGGEWERMGTTGKKNITNVRQQLFGETTAEKVKNKALQFITFSEINGKIEAASRFAEYKYGRNATGTDNTFNTLTNKVRTALGQETNNGEVTDESKRKAFMSAQEATVDFQRTGTGLQNFKKCIPFFNATMQGNYQDFRVVTNLAKSGEEGYRARETLTKTVINNIISGILAAGMNLWFGSDDDKDEYLNVDEGIKSDYILLPGRRWLGNIVGEDVATFIYGGRDANRAPISAGTLEHIFYNFGRKTVEDIYTGKEVTGIGKDLVSIAWNSVITGFSELTTIYSPIQNVNENMAWYGDQLIPDRVMSDHPIDKTKWSNSSTSGVASDISKLLNWVNETALGDLFIPDNAVSPIAIEYLAQQYTGIIGQMLLPLLQTNKYTGESITNPTDRTGLGNNILGKVANTAIYMAHSIYNTGLKSYTIDTDASSQIGDTYDEFEDRITDIVKSANESAPYYIRSDLTTDERTAMFEEAKAMQSKDGILYEADNYIKEQWAKYGVIMRGEEWTETDESGNEVKINYGAYSERDRQILAEGCYKAIRDKQSEVIQTVGEFENKYICDQTLASVFSSGDTTIIPLTKTERKMQSLGEAYQTDRANGERYMTYSEQMYEREGSDTVTPTPDYDWTTKGVKYEIPDEYKTKYDAYFKEAFERESINFFTSLDSGMYSDNYDEELKAWKQVRTNANSYAREMYRLDYGIT